LGIGARGRGGEGVGGGGGNATGWVQHLPRYGEAEWGGKGRTQHDRGTPEHVAVVMLVALPKNPRAHGMQSEAPLRLYVPMGHGPEQVEFTAASALP
jgi:hypothetical protein